MRLSLQDKNELLKAALKATSLESLQAYVVSVVDAIDSLPDSKSDAPAPVYGQAVAAALADIHGGFPTGWQNGMVQPSLSTNG